MNRIASTISDHLPKLSSQKSPHHTPRKPSSSRQSSFSHTSHVSCMPRSRKHINIIVVGPSQAGKSSLIEMCRKYEHTDYVIDSSKIGNLVSSHTAHVNSVTIRTKFPEYEACETTRDMDGQEFTAFEIFPSTTEDGEPLDVDSYDDYLNKPKLELRKKEGVEEDECTVTFFDTPGLNDTSGKGNDDMHIYNIHRAMQKVGEVHLVIVMVSSKVPMSPGQETAIKTYFTTFPQFLGVVAFVYSNISYHELLSSHHRRNIDARTKALNEIIMAATQTATPMLSQAPPNYLIDCSWYTKKQIRNSISLETIRRILLRARRNIPVLVQSLLIPRTPSMREVDENIVQRCHMAIETLRKQILDWPIEETRLLRQSEEYDAKIAAALKKEDSFKAFMRGHNSKDLHLLAYIDREEDWKFFGMIRSESLKFSTKADFSGIEITRCDILIHEGYSLDKIKGGVGHRFWTGILKRHPYHSGTFRIEFRAPKYKVFRTQISLARTELHQVMAERKRLEDDWQKAHAIQQAEEEKIHTQLDKQRRLQLQIEIAKEKSLNPDLFHELALAHKDLQEDASWIVKLTDRTCEIYDRVLKEREAEKVARDQQYRDEGYGDEISSMGTSQPLASLEDDGMGPLEDDDGEEEGGTEDEDEDEGEGEDRGDVEESVVLEEEGVQVIKGDFVHRHKSIPLPELGDPSARNSFSRREFEP